MNNIKVHLLEFKVRLQNSNVDITVLNISYLSFEFAPWWNCNPKKQVNSYSNSNTITELLDK